MIESILEPAAGDVALRVRLLGRFEVAAGDGVIEEKHWRQRKAAALVKLLALAGGRRLHREELLDRLWPELELDAAANNLHQSLHVARRALESAGGRPRLLLSRQIVSLEANGPIWIDVEEFERAAALALDARTPDLYRRAIDLYGGDLLPDDRYEDWAAPRRELLRETYTSLVLGLADSASAADRLSVIDLLRRVVADDPIHESAHEALMRLYALEGHPRLAIRQYDQLREMLREELDVEPDEAVQRLHADIAAGRFLEPTGTAPATESHNLPAPLTRFIGREGEVDRITTLLSPESTRRVVTLVGLGGIGKTRLAQTVGGNLLSFYPGGVWLVDLAGACDEAMLLSAVAVALGVRERTEMSLSELVASRLREQRTLLVLDNCEHLIDACAKVTGQLLEASPDLRILATSREPLDVSGEVVWRVLPLPLPDSDEVDAVGASEAVQLLADRVSCRDPRAELASEHFAAAAAICRRLDGIPLAIELVAAQVPNLTLPQIADRLDRALPLLESGPRNAVTRHRTLRAALDWSYELLDERERTALGRLSVFAGGCSVEAAEEVCGEGTPDLLSALGEKSLISVAVSGNEVRYRLLEVVRQYANERLLTSEDRNDIAARHAAYYLSLAEAADAAINSPDQHVWLDRLDWESDNLRAALAWMVEHEEAAMAVRTAAAVWYFWWIRGYPSEGREWLQRALTLEGEVPAGVRAAAYNGIGGLAFRLCDYEAAECAFESSLAVARENGEGHAMRRALGNLGMTILERREDVHRARSLFEECLTLSRESGDERNIAFALGHLAGLDYEQAEYTAAAGHYRESLALHRKAGDANSIAICLHNLGDVARRQGEPGIAQAYYEESLDLWRQLGADYGLASTLGSLGHLARELGDVERATALYAEALPLRHASGQPTEVADVLVGFAAIALAGGRVERSGRLLGAVEALRESIDVRPAGPERIEEERILTAAREIDAGSFDTAWELGRLLSAESAIELALAD